MLKMMGKTNIDFIGPRYICMAGSLIVIVLGLVATAVRGQGMFNIDFTGGTLVTIRLNENDPDVKALSESQRAEFVREKAERPARRDGREPAGRRGQEPGAVQHPHDRPEHRARQADDPRGVRLEPGAGRDDLRRRQDRSPATAPAGRRGPEATPPAFAGGRRIRPERSTPPPSTAPSRRPRSSRPSSPRSSTTAKIANPTSRFEIKEATAPSPTAEST